MTLNGQQLNCLKDYLKDVSLEYKTEYYDELPQKPLDYIKPETLKAIEDKLQVMVDNAVRTYTDKLLELCKREAELTVKEKQLEEREKEFKNGGAVQMNYGIGHDSFTQFGYTRNPDGTITNKEGHLRHALKAYHWGTTGFLGAELGLGINEAVGCVCKTFDLMARGCTCGFIQKERGA